MISLDLPQLRQLTPDEGPVTFWQLDIGASLVFGG